MASDDQNLSSKPSLRWAASARCMLLRMTVPSMLGLLMQNGAKDQLYTLFYEIEWSPQNKHTVCRTLVASSDYDAIKAGVHAVSYDLKGGKLVKFSVTQSTS